MKSTNQKQASALQTVVINDSRFAVEEVNGNISFNLTQMSKPFGDHKKPSKWLRTDESKRYLESLSKAHKCPLADLLEVRKGGTPELAGTWANDYRIAIRYAQWLDMDFAIAVDELVYKVLTKQAVVLEPKRGVMPIYHNFKKLYSYADALKSFNRKPGNHNKRKKRHPQHFEMLFGRNFITEHYFDLLTGYYNYVDSQLAIEFEKGGNHGNV